MTLSQRFIVPEKMDQPDLDPKEHRLALQGLSNINRISLTTNSLYSKIAKIASQSEAIRVLEIACGGGDVICDLAKRAQEDRLAIRFIATDRSPVAIEVARSRAAKMKLANIEFSETEVFTQEDRFEEVDIVFCTLFLHHLEQAEAIRLLEIMRKKARRMVIVDDLRRSRLGYLLAWFGCRIFSRSSIVHFDGPQSVRAAFTMKEAEDLAREAAWESIRFERHWPQRFSMIWEPK